MPSPGVGGEARLKGRYKEPGKLYSLKTLFMHILDCQSRDDLCVDGVGRGGAGRGGAGGGGTGVPRGVCDSA